jgi:hypothetical protein
MELHLTPEEESQLAEIAQYQGTTAGVLLAELARGLIEETDHQREIIRERVRRADLGVFIEHDEMDKRVEAMLQSR